MGSTSSKGNTPVIIAVAVVLVVFVIIILLFKKIFKIVNTESPVLDETSKKILNDKKLVEDYYNAIEMEKNGKPGNITVDGEEYKIIRAGKYNSPVASN